MLAESQHGPRGIYDGVHEVSSDEELSNVIPIIDAIDQILM